MLTDSGGMYMKSESMNRRDILRAGGRTISPMVGNNCLAAAQSTRKKRVLIMGAGIAGLACAYELVRRGHDVTVLEASGRAGGHVRTFHDQFADGLYADIGAEHFYYPGYTEYWRYVKEFSLTPIPYPRRDHMVRFLDGERLAEDALHSRTVLARLGFNQRESDFLANHSWPELQLLYFERFVEQIRDERNPFTGNLARLDQLSVADLLRQEGASPAALRFFGGTGSALQSIWGAAIKKLRGTDLETKKLFRLDRKSVV